MQRNTGYFPTESLEPSGNRLFSRSALNEGDLFRGSLAVDITKISISNEANNDLLNAATENHFSGHNGGTTLKVFLENLNIIG